MTIHVICVVKDAKADVYGTPMVFPSEGVAIRTFVSEINSGSETSLVRKFPDDFSLFKIGTFDDLYATYIPANDVQKPELLISGANAIVRN